MPKVEQFDSGANGWGATFLHECVHATGTLLKRDPTKSRFFSRSARAMEELVAEIGAATLCNALGIESKMRESHAAYVQSWLEALDNDDTAIFTAARMAQAAVDLLLEGQLPKVYDKDKSTPNGKAEVAA
jgi:antirestriction protein ArdC